MKAIINGKRYDTNAPMTQEVASWSNGLSYSDFGHVVEALYRTGHGNWFLVGSGGPMSRYAERSGSNSWSGGSRLVPVTAQDAQAWLEEKGQTSAIEKWFAADIQDA